MATPQPVSPGQTLQQLMRDRGWNQYDLAEVLGVQQTVVSSLVNDKRPISIEIARALAAVFDTGADYWLHLDVNFRLFSSESNDDHIVRRAKLFAIAPVRDMIKRRWIQGASDTGILEKQVLGFYGVSTLDDIVTPPHAAKKSSSYADTTPSERAWMQKARTMARMVGVTRQYTEKGFAHVMSEFKRLLLHPESLRQIPKLLADVGVRFVVVEPLPRTRIDGVCLWLDSDAPVVALSLRTNQIDSIWFSLLHELGHVKRCDGLLSPVIIDSDLTGENSVPSEKKPEAEKDADLFASGSLVDPSEMDNFIARISPLYSKQRILGFAKRIGVHPGLVVGQLQHRREMEWGQNREFLAKVRDIITQVALTDGWGQTLPAFA